jgi:malonyl-CoA O-methyltransferase
LDASRSSPDRAGTAAPVLPARLAYRLWAARYDEETAVSALEERVVRALTPALEGRTLLDAACGTGRRLPEVGGAPRPVGIDLVPAMLAQARRAGRSSWLAAADLRALPFADARFDVLWCRLALGHLAELAPAYVELARVARPGARLVVSDFHADAVAAGHTRTFRDAEGRVHAVEHHVHRDRDHRRAATAAGWRLEHALHAPAGPEERGFYERAGRLDQLERERGLPLVLAMRFRR